jgi:hypothetical protein
MRALRRAVHYSGRTSSSSRVSLVRGDKFALARLGKASWSADPRRRTLPTTPQLIISDESLNGTLDYCAIGSIFHSFAGK